MRASRVLSRAGIVPYYILVFPETRLLALETGPSSCDVSMSGVRSSSRPYPKFNLISVCP